MPDREFWPLKQNSIEAQQSYCVQNCKPDKNETQTIFKVNGPRDSLAVKNRFVKIVKNWTTLNGKYEFILECSIFPVSFVFAVPASWSQSATLPAQWSHWSCFSSRHHGCSLQLRLARSLPQVGFCKKREEEVGHSIHAPLLSRIRCSWIKWALSHGLSPVAPPALKPARKQKETINTRWQKMSRLAFALQGLVVSWLLSSLLGFRLSVPAHYTSKCYVLKVTKKKNENTSFLWVVGKNFRDRDIETLISDKVMVIIIPNLSKSTFVFSSHFDLIFTKPVSRKVQWCTWVIIHPFGKISNEINIQVL